MKKVQPFAWKKFIAELIGTALLLLLGLSVVILMFGSGNPVERMIPSVTVRRVITGFLFGSTGALIAISVLGKNSGAHINPIVTMAFWLYGKIDSKLAIIYIFAQLTGAILGSLPLLVWGAMGKSVVFGATLPGEGYSLQTVLLGEIITTFTMVSLLIVFLAFREIRAYTPAIFPVLYATMVPLEAAISGTSTNPARSLGPSVVSGEWDGWWIYWVGPCIGSLLACIVCYLLAKRITVAKLYHFDIEPKGLLQRMGTGRRK